MKHVLLLLAVLCGCHGQPAPVAAPVSAVSAAAAGNFARYELPLHGASAEFPAKPDQSESSHTRGDDGEMTTTTLAVAHEDHEYGIAFSSRGGRDRPSDEAWIAGIRKGLGPKARVEEESHGDFRGLSAWYEKGEERFACRYLFVGDGFLTAFVGVEGRALDEVRARRFLDSVRYELPWRIVPFPAGRFSIAVPAAAVELGPEQWKLPADNPSRGFFVGGKHDLLFTVWTLEIAADNELSPDDLMDNALGKIRDAGTAISWRAAYQFEGLRGLEFLGHRDGVQWRGRLLVVDHYLYVLQAQAKALDALTTPEVKRFFESLRWY
jgi:hypothetical protein